MNRCTDVVNAGGGECMIISDQNYLWYEAGYVSYKTPWADYFTINIPCNVSDACSSSSKVFPPEGTYINYEDENGAAKPPAPWDVNISIKFNYRDLTAKFLRAIIANKDLVYVDTNAANIGMLDAAATTLNYYVDDPYTGTLLKQNSIQALSSGAFQVFYNDLLEKEGWIYAAVNPDGNIRECPGNNIATLYCTGAETTQYFSLGIWAWRD